MRSPLLHTLVLGFIIALWAHARAPLRVDVSEIQWLWAIDAWEQQRGRSANRSEREALLDSLIDQQLLLQYALKQNLDDSPVVQHRLKQLADFLDQDTAPANSIHSDPVIRQYLATAAKAHILARGNTEPPSDTDLKNWYQTHAEQFQEPERRALSHVYFGGLSAASFERADSVEHRLDSVEKSLSLGDVFHEGHHLAVSSRTQVSARYGEDFANEAMRAALQQWHGPVQSSYGYHWLFVHEIRPAKPKPFSEVRAIIARRVSKAREDDQLREALAALRATARINAPSLNASQPSSPFLNISRL